MTSFPNNENIVKVIKILGEILDKEYEDASPKTLLLGALKDILKLFFPEKSFRIYGVLFSILLIASIPLRYFKSEYYSYEAYLVVIIYIVYVLHYAYYRHTNRIKSAKINKELPSHSEIFISSIIGKGRTLAEKNYEPFFNNSDVERILQNLTKFGSDTLKSTELIITYQDGLIKKNFEYFSKFSPIILPLLIYIFYKDKQIAAILIGLISLFVFYIQIKSEKYSIKGKYELCIYLLKQAQVLKNK